MSEKNEYDEILDANEFGNEVQKSNEYDSFLNDQDLQKGIALRTAFHVSRGISPDKFASIYTLSKETGLPTTTVERNEKKLLAQKEFETNDYDKLLTDRPKTSAFLTNPDNVKLTKDALDDLGNIEDDFDRYNQKKLHLIQMKQLGVPTTSWGRFWDATYSGFVGDISTNKINASWDIGEAQVKAGQIGFGMIMKELSGGYNDASEADMAAAEAKKQLDLMEANNFNKEGVLSMVLYGGTEMLPQVRDSGIAGIVGAGLGAVVGSTVGQTKTGARLGMTFASFKKALELESGNAFLEYREFTDENGEKIDPKIAAVAALAAGSVNAGLEVVQIGRWASDIPGINKLANLKGGMSTFISKALKNPEVRKKLIKLSEKYGVEVLGETSIELMQEAVGIFAGELAKDADSDKVFEDKSVIEGVAEAAPEIMASMAGVTGMTHFGGKTIRTTGKNIKKLANTVNEKKMAIDKQYLQSVAELSEYEQTIPQYRAIVERVENSKLFKRSKQAMSEFLATVKQDTTLENIIIDGQILNEQVDAYLQNIEPDIHKRETLKENLFREMGIDDAIRNAQTLGEEVTIPIERFIPAVAGTELKTILEGDIRFSENGKSYNQIVNENKYFQDRVNKEIFTEDKLTSVEGQVAIQLQEVSDDIEAKLQYVGRPKDEATAMAQIWKARALAVWDRDKITPKEWYESQGLIVAKGSENIIAFEPTQIKSVDNPSTLDKNNPNIYFQPVLAPDIRNKKVNVVDLTKEFKGIPTKEALIEKINALIKSAKAIPTKSVEKLIDFKDDPKRNIVGHIVESSIGSILNPMEKSRHSIILNSIEDLIKESVFVEKEKNNKPWKRGVEEYYRFYVPVKLRDKIYTVRLVAEKYKGEKNLRPDVSHLYDVIIERKSPQASNGKTALSDSPKGLSIKVSQMLKNVKGFDDTFYTQDKARGMVQFSDERTIVRLMEKANHSTFLHETGHIFLKDLKGIALNEHASAQTKADWDVLKKHYGMTDETITDAQHEQFARDFEGYLMEGRSPSKALQSVFRRFKSWLISIYKKADNLNLSINDDIREVFDRLVATDEEIQKYAVSRDQLFYNAKDARMSEDEFANYLNDIEQIKQENTEEAERRIMEKVKRLRSDEYRTKTAELISEAKASLEKTDRNYRAMKLIRENDKFKISPDEVKNFYEFDVDKLPAELLGTTGQDLQNTAFELDYNGPADMLLNLSRAENIEDVAKRKANEQMAKLYPDDYLDDFKISEVVQEVLDANDKEGDIAFNEYLALKGDRRTQILERATIENKIDNKIAFTKVRDLKTGRFKSAVDKWRYDAYAQNKSGDKKAAAFSKLKQFINQVLVTRIQRAKGKMAVQARFLERLNKPVNEMNVALPLETREAIYDLLKDYNTDPKVSQREVDALKSYAKAYEDGLLKEVQPNRLAQGQKTYYGDMTVKDFTDLYNEVNGLYTEGMNANKIKIEEHEIELQKAIDDFIIESEKRFGKKQHDIQDYVSTQKSTMQKILKVLKDVDVSLTKMSTIAEMIDGKIGGSFHKLILENVNKSEAAKIRLQEKTDTYIKEAFSDFTADDMHKMNVKKSHPMFSKPITQANLFMFLLHAGNPDGRKRLANFWPDSIKFDNNGNQIPLSEGMINNILFNAGDLSLDARHIKAAQKIWKMFDELYPELEKVHRETGKALGKVRSAPLLTPYGVAEGGYFPIYYNNEYGSSVLYDLQEEINQLGFAARGDYYTKTNQGRTKTREKVVLEHAVDLSMNTIMRGIEDTTHDIAYRQTITDLVKIFNHKSLDGKNKDFERAVIDYTNRETYLEMIDWLKDIAVPNRNLYKAEDAFVNNMYRNYSAAVLTYNLKTIMVQWLSFGNIIAELGLKPFMNGIKNFVAHPVKSFETIQMVQEKSDYMRKRTENILKSANRKIMAIDKTLPERINNQVVDFGYHLIALADNGVSYPAWKMAYDKKMLEVKDEKVAIEYADMVVRNNMGSAEGAHQVRMQKEKGLKKFLVAFYTEGAVHYNQAKIAIDAAVRHHEFGKLYAFFVWRFLSIGILEQLIADSIYGDDDKDDKEKWLDFMLGVFSRNFQAVPFFRNFSTRMRTMYEDPLARIMNNLGNLFDTVKTVTERDKKIKTGTVAKSITSGMLPIISGLTGKQIVIPQKFIDYTENMAGYLNDEASPGWQDIFIKNKDLRRK